MKLYSAVGCKSRYAITLTCLPLGVIVQTSKKVSVSEQARMSGEMVDKYPNYEVTVEVLGHLETLMKPIFLHVYYMTQFEIERKSCGQSMTNFRFFSCGGQNNFSGCHSFFMCLVRNIQKTWKKCPKSVQLWLCIRYCTTRQTLWHVRLFEQFLEVNFRHLEAR